MEATPAQIQLPSLLALSSNDAKMATGLLNMVIVSSFKPLYLTKYQLSMIYLKQPNKPKILQLHYLIFFPPRYSNNASETLQKDLVCVEWLGFGKCIQ